MKSALQFCAAIGLFGVCAVVGAGPAAAAGLGLKSSAFANGQPIPKRYACDGAGVSPPLTLSGVPHKAKSLTLIVDDPDAPSGDWTHWVVYDLAPDLAKLATGAGASDHSLPGRPITVANSWHHREYGGVCPPNGDGVHHYRFRLYALNTRLGRGLNNQAAVEKAMQGHIIDQTRLVGTYKRP